MLVYVVQLFYVVVVVIMFNCRCNLKPIFHQKLPLRWVPNEHANASWVSARHNIVLAILAIV